MPLEYSFTDAGYISPSVEPATDLEPAEPLSGLEATGLGSAWPGWMSLGIAGLIFYAVVRNAR